MPTIKVTILRKPMAQQSNILKVNPKESLLLDKGKTLMNRLLIADIWSWSIPFGTKHTLRNVGFLLESSSTGFTVLQLLPHIIFLQQR